MILSLQLEAGTFFHELRWVSSTPPIWVLGTTSIDPATSGNLWQPVDHFGRQWKLLQWLFASLMSPLVANVDFFIFKKMRFNCGFQSSKEGARRRSAPRGCLNETYIVVRTQPEKPKQRLFNVTDHAT